MVFSSVIFICFFLPTVFILYNCTKSVKIQNLILCLFSIVFYAYGEPLFVFYLIFSVLVHFLALRNGNVTKAKVAVLTTLDLGVLFVFKYLNFVLNTVCTVLNTESVNVPIALPIGISFFTFQIISFTVDCYRSKQKTEISFVNLLLYISFFPQLIAGPIVKFHDIKEQLTVRRNDLSDTADGIVRFISGLSKKVIIADTLAVAVDHIFAYDSEYISFPVAWVAAAAYTMQIYFDFSGYSDMAIGLGRMFGFKFLENFNHPFASLDIREFWRRWHISLTTWFKEYVYIPLGGSRKGKVRTVFNRLFVFLLTGIWHGANFTFIIWGIYHGIICMLEELNIIPVNKIRNKPLNRLYTFCAAAIGFLVFRAENLSTAFNFVKAALVGYSVNKTGVSLMLTEFSPFFTAVFAFALLFAFFANDIKEKINAQSKAVKMLKYFSAPVLFVLCLLLIVSNSYSPFIYFQF